MPARLALRSVAVEARSFQERLHCRAEEQNREAWRTMCSSSFTVPERGHYPSPESVVWMDPNESPVIVSRKVVMVKSRHGTYYRLDDVSSRIWDLLRRPRTFGEMVDAISSEYDIDPLCAKREIAELLDILQLEGSLHIDGGNR